MKTIVATARVIATAVIVAWSSLQAETVSLKPIADTTLFETSPSNNLGGDPTLAAGTTAKGLKSRALIRFDLAAGNIPAGATITSAALQIRVVKAPSSANDSVFELRRVLMSWGEGGKRGSTGAAAGTGEATWRARSAPSDLWSAPGGVEGTDFASAVSSSVAISGLANYTFASAANLIADVQFWLEQPAMNFGWLVLSQSEDTSATARRLASSEATQNAPTLVIEYSAGAAPLQITGISVGRTQGTITWSGGSPPYQPQFKRNVADASWTNLGGTVQGTSVDFPVEGDQTYFRIIAGSAAAAP